MSNKENKMTKAKKTGWNKTAECLPKFGHGSTGPLVVVGWRYGVERIARPIKNKEGKVFWHFQGGEVLRAPEFWMNIPAIPN